MFTFIKKLFGFDQETIKAAGVQIEQAPYKVPEPVAPIPLVPEAVPMVAVEKPAPVVEAAPAKPARKPRAPKAPVAEKATPVKKAAAIKAAPKAKTPRSKKV